MKVVQCLGYLSKILLNIQCCHFFSSWRVQMRFERALIYALRCYNKRPPNYIQPRIACSRPCCRRFNTRKSCARDDLATSLDCDKRFRFFKATSHTIAFCTRESAIFFLNSPRKCAGRAPEIIM